MRMAQIPRGQKEGATQCPSTEERTGGRWYLHMMKYYLPVKGTDNREMLRHRGTVNTFGERSQADEATRYMTLSTGNTADPEAESGCVVARAEGGGCGK